MGSDQRVAVPVDDPNADTEWNDLLRKHGVLPPKPPSPTAAIEEAVAAAQQRAHDSRLEDKDLDELAELEDDEDDAFLEQYRWVLPPGIAIKIPFRSWALTWV